MFGVSLSEVALIAIVALVVVGPHKLPGMLRTLGQWIRRLREMTTQVRAQTGIDDILRQEGIDGGIAELRNLIRGDLAQLTRARTHAPDLPRGDDPYEEAIELDRYREYPLEGADAHGAVPDDLVDETQEKPQEEPEQKPSEPAKVEAPKLAPPKLAPPRVSAPAPKVAPPPKPNPAAPKLPPPPVPKKPSSE